MRIMDIDVMLAIAKKVALKGTKIGYGNYVNEVDGYTFIWDMCQDPGTTIRIYWIEGRSVIASYYKKDGEERVDFNDIWSKHQQEIFNIAVKLGIIKE